MEIKTNQKNFLENFRTLRQIRNYLPRSMLRGNNPAYHRYLLVEFYTFRHRNNKITA